MVKYYYSGRDFVIEDFQRAKTFSSFLPAIAGKKGKPIWAFYCSKGQALAGFGVNSKETPITPFESANSAYQNIALKGFRTFVRFQDRTIAPFFDESGASRKMIVHRTYLEIEEDNDLFFLRVTYSTVPEESYAGLIRKVELTPKASGEFEIVDGLPIIFPYGLSNYCYKELVSLMAGYCQVFGKEDRLPFIKFKTSTEDCSEVSEIASGNGYVTLDAFGNRFFPLVDPYTVFGEDTSLIRPEGLQGKSYEELLESEEQTENKLPSAFSLNRIGLNSGQTYAFFSVFGSFDDRKCFEEKLGNLTLSDVERMIERSEEIVEELIRPMKIRTSDRIFDEYFRQSYLDNCLRGGFPTLLQEDQPYYLYSRKHGDMERDYNSFRIPSKYYSSGSGNFRDVNQNRRNDLYFAPYLKDYNIHLFFDLIQIDGQNPLNVRPPLFRRKSDFDESVFASVKSPLKEKLICLSYGFEPSEMFTLLKDGEDGFRCEEIFEKVLKMCAQTSEADFGEGYWIDHWTYNVDLLENYLSVYPDRMEEALFRDDYRYFYSPVYVQPREEKYCLLPDGKIRQYGAVDLKELKIECEKTGFDIRKTAWLKDRDGKEIRVSLIAKIVHLIAIKFSTLDHRQLGIEMECEKPGWNDAMNGLPGLFASGESESIELLRLALFAEDQLKRFSDRKVVLLKEQEDFLRALGELTSRLEEGKLTRFDFWDRSATLREDFRLNVRKCVSGETREIGAKEIRIYLSSFERVLVDGLKRAKSIGKGLLPSYWVYRVEDYELTGKTTHLGYPSVRVKSFAYEELPPFLEACARSFKLPKEMLSRDLYENIKNSGIYDRKLKIYKTCAPIDDAPFEIGRIHAFTKGWLERECDFLHMTYKYLLGLLKGGFVDEFYEESRTNLVCFMNPEVYGRSTLENSSFIVPSNNPDSKLHGRGFFARLTGANTELLQIGSLLFFGERLFVVEGGQLKLNLNPLLKKEMFDDQNEVSFRLFDSTEVVYVNDERIDTYPSVKFIAYEVDGKRYTEIKGKIAEDLRDGKIRRIKAYIGTGE